MDTVTVSPKYQVVIPKKVRERLSIVPGQRIHVVAVGDRIEFIPVRPAAELRGALKGVSAEFERDRSERV